MIYNFLIKSINYVSILVHCPLSKPLQYLVMIMIVVNSGVGINIWLYKYIPITSCIINHASTCRYLLRAVWWCWQKQNESVHDSDVLKTRVCQSLQIDYANCNCCVHTSQPSQFRPAFTCIIIKTTLSHCTCLQIIINHKIIQFQSYKLTSN